MSKKNNNEKEYYEILENDTKQNIFKTIITILLLCLCLFGLYKLIIVSNKAIFKSGINNTYNTIEKYLNKIDFLSNQTNINGVLTIDATDNNINQLNDYKFNLDFNFDNNNNKYQTFLDINYNNESKAKLSYLYDNNNSYITLEKLYNKAIKLNNDFKNIKLKELKNIMKIIKNNINNEIKDEYLTNNKEEISINNNKYELDYIELNLSKEKLSKAIGNIITNIKENHKLVEAITNSLNITNQELDNYLDNILKDIIIYNFNELKIRYYYTGYFAKTIGMKVLIDDSPIIEDYNYDNHLFININNKLFIDNDNNQYNIKYYDYTIIIKTLKDNLIDLDYQYNNNKGIIHYEYKDNKGNIKFSYINDSAYSFNYDFTIKENINIDSIDEDNITTKEKIKEDDYLDIYNYIENNFNNDYLENILKYLVQELIKY